MNCERKPLFVKICLITGYAVSAAPLGLLKSMTKTFDGFNERSEKHRSTAPQWRSLSPMNHTKYNINKISVRKKIKNSWYITKYREQL
mmetsp:Transcript_44890/g.50744  ORF Transcript_44890/g.50744 Transcript_44890/m.50744 type:complete len:88 (-) Transcript_44890:1646-1909(-)